ncbi:MAG: bifunctional pyr operon transcriptional regulator/uracil phosphoribosyltransferase PyrR [Actinomycetes bacterium]
MTQASGASPETSLNFVANQVLVPNQVLVLGQADVNRAITRIAHEIIERNRGLDGVVIVGLQRGGVWLAERLVSTINQIEGETSPSIPLGKLDVSLFRDDISLRPVTPVTVTDIPVDLAGSKVVLVDDVLFTGRTVRAALDALNQYGRPSSVQLAVMIDRGHRELPIRPDYVGKNLPTGRDEDVLVSPEGVTLSKKANS